MAAFSISGYAWASWRYRYKPFNPVLGETYESHREDRGFHYVSEQVMPVEGGSRDGWASVLDVGVLCVMDSIFRFYQYENKIEPHFTRWTFNNVVCVVAIFRLATIPPSRPATPSQRTSLSGKVSGDRRAPNSSWSGTENNCGSFFPDQRWKNKFWGKSVEIISGGHVNVTLPK